MQRILGVAETPDRPTRPPRLPPQPTVTSPRNSQPPPVYRSFGSSCSVSPVPESRIRAWLCCRERSCAGTACRSSA
ncbi:hypothetical protein STEG23_035345 [Scotinomys teguina]